MIRVAQSLDSTVSGISLLPQLFCLSTTVAHTAQRSACSFAVESFTNSRTVLNFDLTFYFSLPYYIQHEMCVPPIHLYSLPHFPPIHQDPSPFLTIIYGPDSASRLAWADPSAQVEPPGRHWVSVWVQGPTMASRYAWTAGIVSIFLSP